MAVPSGPGGRPGAPSTIAVIPAKGPEKSTRVPGKNLRTLGGKPLVAWTIEAALGAGSIDRVLVSTESHEVAAVADAWGAEVLARPGRLAHDPFQVPDVVLHAMENTEGRPDQTVAILLPTSPFRGSAAIDQAIGAFEEFPVWSHKLPHKAVISVVESRSDHMAAIQDQLMCSVTHNGAVLVWSRDALLREGGWVRRSGAKPLYMDPSTGLDINTEDDWTRAEHIAERLAEKAKTERRAVAA